MSVRSWLRYRWIFTTKRSLFLEKIDFQKRHNFPCLKKVLPLKILLSRDFFTTLEEKRIFIEKFSFFPHFFKTRFNKLSRALWSSRFTSTFPFWTFKFVNSFVWLEKSCRNRILKFYFCVWVENFCELRSDFSFKAHSRKIPTWTKSEQSITNSTPRNVKTYELLVKWVILWKWRLATN